MRPGIPEALPARLLARAHVRGTVFLLLMAALLCSSRIAAAQDDTSLSNPLSDPLSDSLSNDSATSGLSSEVVSGASSLVSGSIKTGISDPTGALIENSLRSPYVSAGANSDPSQGYHADVEVDASRTSMVDVYSGSRAAFQPAFAGTLEAGFRGGARTAAQRPAGSSLALATPDTKAAFGRGTQLQAFGSAGAASDMTGTDASGNPLIYLDPNLVQNSTLVTDVGSIPGQQSYPAPGSAFPVLVTDNFAGAGGFPDSTRGTAGSPPQFTAPAQPFVSPTGMRDSPFTSISQTDTFLHPTLLLNPLHASRQSARLSTSPTPEQRRARILALLSGSPEARDAGTPTFEQRRVDKLSGARQRPGERQRRVTLSATTHQ